MRKLLSVLLATALILTAFAAVPATAATTTETASDSTLITFDEDLYKTENGVIYATLDTETFAGNEHGNVIKYTIISKNAAKWPQVMRLADSNGALTFEKDNRYFISMDIKREVLNKSFNMHFVSLQSYNGLGNVTGFPEGYFATVEQGDNEWTKISAVLDTSYFTNETSNLALVFRRSDGEVKNQQIYIDNIKIQKISSDYAYADFSEDFYKTDSGIYGATLETLEDDEHGAVAKYTKISKATSYGNDGKYPDAVRIANSSGFSAFSFEKGANYEISLDIKKVKAENAFNIYLYALSESSGLAGVKFEGENKNYAYYEWIGPGASDGWTTIKKTINTDFFSSDRMNLAITLYRSNTMYTNQEIYIDNITVKRVVDVTLNTNNGVEAGTKAYGVGTPISEISAYLAGAELESWYYDAALTKPANGDTVTANTRALYAKWKSFTYDADNCGLEYVSNQNTTIAEYEGYANSKAYAMKYSSNSSWPEKLQLLNKDGTAFNTVPGHTYSLSLRFKAKKNSDATELYSDQSCISIDYTSSKSYDAASFTTAYDLVEETDGKTKAYSKPKVLFEDADDKETYKTVTYNIKANETSELPVYITTRSVAGVTYFDDIKITDLTAQYTAKAEDGTVLASGYYGESYTLPETDEKGDTNRIYWSDTANGAEVTGGMLTGNATLYPVTSQIALTKTDALVKNSKPVLSAKLIFDGIEGVAADNGLTLNYITIGNTRYIVSEIGVIVAPAAALNGAELTAENYTKYGGKVLKNSELKYTTLNNGKLAVESEITVANAETEYAVVGYVKYGISGKTLYSKNRSGIKLSYVDAAGLDKTDSYKAILNGCTYTLTFNDEFNNGSNVYDKWNCRGDVFTDSGITKYSVPEMATILDGKLCLTSVKDGNTMKFSEISGNHLFTHGYIEFAARYADVDNLSGAFWLVGSGLKDEELAVEPSGSDTYVIPEIDIIEFDSKSLTYSTLHSWARGATTSKFNRISIDQYKKSDYFKLDVANRSVNLDLSQRHVYGFERTSDEMRFYIDGKLAFEVNRSDSSLKSDDKGAARTDKEIQALFDNPVYFRLSAFCGTAGTATESTSYIDYIRVYE